MIISGAGVLQLGTREEALAAPGDVLSVNSDEPHAIVNRGFEALRFVCLDCYLH